MAKPAIISGRLKNGLQIAAAVVVVFAAAAMGVV